MHASLFRPLDLSISPKIDAARPVTDLLMFTSVEWNVSAGGIRSLVTKAANHDFVRGRDSFAQYQYQTLTEHDFWVFMNETLRVPRDVAFAKKNLTQNANTTSGFWTGSLQKMYRSKHNHLSDIFLQSITVDKRLHTHYGAPARVWVRFEFSKVEAEVNVTVSIFNKTSTRLPEAHWVDFEIAVPAASTASSGPRTRPAGSPSLLPQVPLRCDSWSVAKLGSTFCATDVSLFGSTHIHAVTDANHSHGSVLISEGATTLRLTSLDVSTPICASVEPWCHLAA